MLFTDVIVLDIAYSDRDEDAGEKRMKVKRAANDRCPFYILF